MKYRKGTYLKWTQKDDDGRYTIVMKVESHKDGTIIGTNEYGSTMGTPDTEGSFRKTTRPKSWDKVKAAPRAPQARPTTVPKTRRAPRAGVTKMDQVLTLLNAERPVSRKAAIALVVDTLGMTPAGASTYASNANKTLKLW